MNLQALEPGTALADRFIIEAKIGGGGMAAVYAVREVGARQAGVMVLKAVPRDDVKSRERLHSEFLTVKSLHHPNIIHAHEWGEDEEAGCAFYVMDCISGVSFTEFVKRNWITLGEALQLFSQVLYAVAYMHRQGVTHRDLKPSNVLVDRGGQVAIVDFGICRGPLRPEITGVGELTGTLLFVSPEQAGAYLAGGEVEPSTRALATHPRADVYALGVLLYHLLTNNWPHRPPDSTSEAQLDFLHRVQHLRPRSPGEFSSNVPPSLSRIAMAMLNPQASERPATAEAVLPNFEAAMKADAEYLDQLSPLAKPEFEKAMMEDGLAPTQPDFGAGGRRSPGWGMLSCAITAAAAIALTFGVEPLLKKAFAPAEQDPANTSMKQSQIETWNAGLVDLEPGSLTWERDDEKVPSAATYTDGAATQLQHLVLQAKLITGPLPGQKRYPCHALRHEIPWKGACWYRMILEGANREERAANCDSDEIYEPEAGYCKRTGGQIYVPVFLTDRVKKPTSTLGPEPDVGGSPADSKGYGK